VKRMDGAIRDIANALIDDFVADGQVEFMEAFAKRLPLYVIADLLGVPREHEALLHRMADATTTMGDGGLRTRDEIFDLHRVQIEGQKVFQSLFGQYRRKPEENLLSYLIHSRLADGSALTDRHLHSLIQLFLVGGNDTTPGALGNGMYVLARDPQLQAQLRADTTLIPKFVEEVLRFESPVAGLYRFVKRDTVLGGVPLPEGATVSCRLNAGNRDAARFVEPDVFDITRKGARNHLGFGAGVHYCVGINLGRAEVTVGWEALLLRLDDFRLQDARFVPTFQDKLNVRNPISIPISFSVRK
jgi:cytochrome P450